MNKPKRKSTQRFEQLNLLVDVVCPSLTSPSHVAVVMVCYRHARENGEFQVSTERIARAVRLSERHVKRVLDDLERASVLKMKLEHRGPIPRRYRFTGKPANGDTHVTIKKPTPPN